MKFKVSTYLTSATALALLASPLAVPLAHSQEVYSQIVGAIAIDVPAQSDVMVAFPFKQSPSFRGALISQATNKVTVAANSLTVGEFDADGEASHFLYVETGTLEGQRFDIASNTASDITLDVDASALTGIGTATVSVRSHWTVGEAFAGGVAGVEEDQPGLREIEVIIPEMVSEGGGLTASRVLFYYNGAWRELGKALSVSADNVVFYPEASVVLRNNGAESRRTYFYGEVVTAPLSIPIVSSASQSVDNFVSLQRPIGIALKDLGLHGTAVFQTSTGSDEAGIKDRLLVYAQGSGKNKSPVAQYYYFNGAWRKSGALATASFDSEKIETGMGIAIHKAAGSAGTNYWVNDWSLDL